ncbi:MAG TPA: thioredoxin family protein [Haloplasmataceae bacterium]
MIIYAEENNLNELIKEGFSLVDFYSETCGPCKMLAEFLIRLDSELPFINIIKVNTTKYPNYSDEYQIHAVPTLFFIKDGNLCERHLGLLTTEQLKTKIAQYLY